VDQTADTAALLRRMVRRALTVIGGAIAGTAIAWAISSASASADPSCAAPLAETPALHQVSGSGAALSDVVCSVARTVPSPAVADLGTGAGQTADDFGRDLADQFGWVPPVPVDLDELGRSDRSGEQVAPGGGAHEPPSLVRPVGDQTAAAPALAVTPRFDPGVLVPSTATDRALGDGMTRRGSPAPSTPAPLPAAPATVPVSGSSGHSGGGTDSPAFSTLPWSTGPCGLTASRALPAAELLPATGPGTQPGVTPD
jgi:hypothetical protein